VQEYWLVGYRDPKWMPVRWQVTGGTPPYELTIDRERRDHAGFYDGPSGLARVSCALGGGETF